MALKTAGKSSILNHMSTTFTHISIGGTFTHIVFDNPYEVPFNLDGLPYSGTPAIVADTTPATITWSGNTVFTINLSAIHANATQVIIRHVRLVDATNDNVYLERDFASTYSYTGNGTFTVTSITISLS